MISHDEARHADSSNQSSRNATSLLLTMQTRLSRLERKMDDILGILQERHYRGNPSVERSFHKKPLLNSRASGRFDNRKFEKRNEKSGEEGMGLKFYSRFTKQNGNSRHGKKTFPLKPQKRT